MIDLFTLLVLTTVTTAAAVIDLRSGRIPNWLTIPSLVIGLGVQLARWGVAGLGVGLLGALVCTVVPGLLRAASKGQAIGGGDLKLFAAIGGWVGPLLGLEIQFSAFVLLATFAVLRLAYEGKLPMLLRNVACVALGPFARRFRFHSLAHDTLTDMRLGPAIALGLLVTFGASRLSALLSWA